MTLSKSKKLILVGILLSVIHFSLNYYVAYQIGSKAGLAAAKMLTNGMEYPKSLEKEYKETKNSISIMIEDWRRLMYIVSFPLGIVIDPIEKRLIKKYVYEPVLNKERHYEEVKTLGYVISFSGSLLNSIAFSFFIIGTWLIFRRIFRKEKRWSPMKKAVK